MIGLVAIRGPKLGYCNICDTYGQLTADHVPPKGTLGIPQVDLLHITELLNVEQPHKQKKRRHMQSGVHFRSICAHCNNFLLGKTYDPALISFSNSVTKILKSSLILPNVISVEVTPGLVARAVIGHLLAVGIERRGKTPLMESAVRFFLNISEPLPDGVDIFYWLHPHRHQVQIRDAVLIGDYFKSDSIVFWCLKYFPLGFLVTWDINDRRMLSLPNLRDFLLHAGNHLTSIPLSLRSLPDAYWPEAPSDDGAVLYGDGAVGAVPHMAG